MHLHSLNFYSFFVLDRPLFLQIMFKKIIQEVEIIKINQSQSKALAV
jgi:hypothetical protein